jgi:hypothetical protein
MTTINHRARAIVVARRLEFAISEGFYAYMTTGSALAAFLALAAPHLGGLFGALLHGRG